MRKLVVLFLLVALPATAQNPVITDFNTNGFVTWTNPDTNAFFTTDWTWNLGYTWIEMDSMAQATQHLMHTSVWDVGNPGEDLEDVLMTFRSYAELFGDRTDSLFVRIRISPDEHMSGWVTNWIRVSNASTSALENIEFGLESGIGNRFDRKSVVLLPPHTNTAFHEVSFAWPDNLFNVIGHELSPVRYYVTYTQNGNLRDFVTDRIMPIGPPRKEITFVVSNNSYTVKCEWLPIGITQQY